MKKVPSLIILLVILVSLLGTGCSGTRFALCTSNGIITYNRHTGQFEMLWEYSQKNQVVIHDTIWKCPDDTISNSR